MKYDFMVIIGIVGSFVASLFGGWDSALTTLLIFMGVDYITGLIVAGVFHNSGKSKTGALEGTLQKGHDPFDGADRLQTGSCHGNQLCP